MSVHQPPASAQPLAGGAWGAGKNHATNRLQLSSSLNACKGVIVTITERVAAWRRERRVLPRVSRAAWRLDQAERERAWALASARAEGISIRKLAKTILVWLLPGRKIVLAKPRNWASNWENLVGAVGFEPTNPSLVRRVLLIRHQGPSERDLGKQVCQGTWKSVSVRGDCHSVSHSAMGAALTLNRQLCGQRQISFG